MALRTTAYTTVHTVVAPSRVSTKLQGMQTSRTPDRRVPTRTRRGRTGEPQARTALLDAMGQLLLERRLDEISVSEIARTAGVSRGAFYMHFDSKFSVIASLVDGDVKDLWRPLLDGDGPIDETVLRDVLQVMAEHWLERATFLAAVIEGWHSDSEIHDVWGRVREDFDRAVAERIRRTGLDIADPEGLAAALVSMTERCVYLNVTNVGPLADSTERLVDSLATVWLGALRSR